jgi:hypothetical protein
MPEVVTRHAVEASPRRVLWEGLGDHGFAYVDSLDDTGDTLVPRCSRMAGGTGAFGDPLWETLAGTAGEFIIFAKAAIEPPVIAIGGLTVRAKDLPYDWDVVTITPFRTPLRRPEALPAVATPQVALEEVLTILRSQAGLPVGDLAAMLGVSRRQFYNWVGRVNEPDTEQEQRIRRSAALIASAHCQLGEPRAVRATLLAPTPHGSAFDALKAGDLKAAESAITVATAGLAPARDVATPSQRRPYDRERVLVELEHLRDVPLRGDG